MKAIHTHHAACVSCGSHVGFLDFGGEVHLVDPKGSQHGRALFLTIHKCRPEKTDRTATYTEEHPKHYPGWIGDNILEYLKRQEPYGTTLEELKSVVFTWTPEVTGLVILHTLNALLRDQRVKRQAGSGYRGQVLWASDGRTEGAT